MNTFPYDSWDAALADLGAYYTWADNDTAIKIITIIGIVMSLYWMYSFVTTETSKLDEKASELASKYRSN